MMSLKPRNVDFQETWANLKETVAGVVGLRRVERQVWNTRFSDVYALCVAHPEPLADRLYDETRAFLEEHVAGLLTRVRGGAHLDHSDHNDGLLIRYVTAWREYSQGVAYLNCLYSYLNLQHVKRQKVSDAEIIYGSAAAVSCVDHESRQLEVGELGLVIWERVLIRPLSGALTSRLLSALSSARAGPLDPALGDAVRAAVHSCVAAAACRVRDPLALYRELVLDPYLAAAYTHHAATAAQLLHDHDVSHYMKHVLEGLEREREVCARYLHAASAEAVRGNYERAAVAAHLPALHAHAPALLHRAAADPPQATDLHLRRDDLRRMYQLLRPLGAAALRPLVEAAHAHAEREGRQLLDRPHHKDEAHAHFVTSMLALHNKYAALFADVFDGAQPFVGALDKACSAVVNSRVEGGACRSPELVARYCDCALRRRAPDPDTDDRLAAAIVVFKYLDDKDVFQKYYARALARRLIHQLSASMDQEEAMINRLKAACGYEFTNKLHRMFTDVAVSADLNAKFQQHLRDTDRTIPTGFFIQVVQAGAWPLGGAGAAAGAPPGGAAAVAAAGGVPAPVEAGARLFEEFYRGAFSGRRLAWLHHLCTGDLRTKYTHRIYHLTATTTQCAILLSFESVDVWSERELREQLQLSDELWTRHARPLLDAGLLTHSPPADGADSEGADADDAGTIALNFSFTCKRTKVRLTCANLTHQGGGGAGGAGGEGSEPAACEDDRKMYLQAAIVRIMKQRKVVRHNDLIQEVLVLARGSFAPSVALVKKCIEALIDKQYLERAPGRLDTYSYLA